MSDMSVLITVHIFCLDKRLESEKTTALKKYALASGTRSDYALAFEGKREDTLLAVEVDRRATFEYKDD